MNTAFMASSGPKAAVCIIRVERESRGLLITVTVNRDVAEARAEPPIRFTATSEAVATVIRFLESFENECLP